MGKRKYSNEIGKIIAISKVQFTIDDTLRMVLPVNVVNLKRPLIHFLEDRTYPGV